VIDSGFAGADRRPDGPAEAALGRSGRPAQEEIASWRGLLDWDLVALARALVLRFLDFNASSMDMRLTEAAGSSASPYFVHQLTH